VLDVVRMAGGASGVVEAVWDRRTRWVGRLCAASGGIAQLL
jgi:hypothetical protein